MQSCLKPRGARGTEPETFRRRGQLLSHPPTTGPTTVPDHAAFRSVPSAVETSGYMGKQAAKFVNCLGEIAAESGSIAKGAYVRWAMQLLSVTVQRGNAEMYRRSGLIISREQGLCYDAGFAVPVLMS